MAEESIAKRLPHSDLPDLYAKGLSSKTLQRLAKGWKNPEEELQAIHHLLTTRYRTKDLHQYKSRQKSHCSSHAQSYAFDQIQTALQKLM